MSLPKMPDFAAAFLKNCGKCCDVLSTFVAIKLLETVEIAHTPSLISLRIQHDILKTVFTLFLTFYLTISLSQTHAHTTHTHTQTETHTILISLTDTCTQHRHTDTDTQN